MCYYTYMKKLLKKYIVIEFHNFWKDGDIFQPINIWFEYSYGGYAMEIMVLNFGVYLRINTEKSLKYFRKLDRDAKELLKELKTREG